MMALDDNYTSRVKFSVNEKLSVNFTWTFLVWGRGSFTFHKFTVQDQQDSFPSEESHANDVFILTNSSS